MECFFNIAEEEECYLFKFLRPKRHLTFNKI